LELLRQVRNSVGASKQGSTTRGILSCLPCRCKWIGTTVLSLHLRGRHSGASSGDRRNVRGGWASRISSVHDRECAYGRLLDWQRIGRFARSSSCKPLHADKSHGRVAVWKGHRPAW